MHLNRDTIVAIVLLAVCAVFWQQSLHIREPDYGQMSPAAWPRAILVLLTVLCLAYLVQSLRQGADAPAAEPGDAAPFLARWRNVLWCFVLFLAYLLSMPFLGMLVGGVLFVFLLLNALGGWSVRLMAMHAVIAVVSMGGMWGLFTYALHVFLPTGSLFDGF